MDKIMETPHKRRKLEASDVSPTGSASSQDEFNVDFLDESAIAALSQNSPERNHAYETQPTQIMPTRLSKPSCGTPAPQIQIAASSPLSSKQSLVPPTIVASSMAPAGTAFRPPRTYLNLDSTKRTSDVIQISDDEAAQGRELSSEDESDTQSADIKPTLFSTSGTQSVDSFKQITSKAKYDPEATLSARDFNIKPLKESVAKNRHTQVLTQRPIVKTPVESSAAPSHLSNQVGDFQMRQKVRRMMQIAPSKTVAQCQIALLKKGNNFQDAVDYLFSPTGSAALIDLTEDDKASSKDSKPSTISRSSLTAKQSIKAPVQKIHEKYSTHSNPSNSTHLSPKPVTSPKKHKRRLVQGRRETQSTHDARSRESSELLFKSQSPEVNISDSGFSEASSKAETDLEDIVLNFLNSCDSTNMVDTAGVSEQTAQKIIFHRPFSSLDTIRNLPKEKVGPRSKGQKNDRACEKAVEKTLEMFQGYQAVDALIKRCDELAKPLTEAMASWDACFDNISRQMVSVEDAEPHESRSVRDSGMGTPSSRSESSHLDDLQERPVPISLRKFGLHDQPSIMDKGISLKTFQLRGFNWLALLFEHKLSAILADDMGLGKTCQVITFLAYLHEKGISGPHLIIVPGSTLENWLREFKKFCPTLVVEPYYGSQSERPLIREKISANRAKKNVVITTYTIAKMKDDNKFLRKLKPTCCIYDEGHMLKNSKSAGYAAYMAIKTDFRVLLSGTPVQNSLSELCALLGFILPAVFQDYAEDLEAIFSHKARTTDENRSHSALLSSQRVTRAKSIMAPFILRRKKDQVLQELPKKIKQVVYCDMSESQDRLYRHEKNRARKILMHEQSGDHAKESQNIMMTLRKAAIHPFLFRALYTDKVLSKMAKACLNESEFANSDFDLVYEDMTVMNDIELHLFCLRYPSSMSGFELLNNEWMDSGKVTVLAGLLEQYKLKGEKVLVFSQFVQVLNILELVLQTLQIAFFRLDGQTKIEERQTMIDQYHDDSDITVFLLSTKAGGAGINLACASKVIIVDSSFNPQDDIQAENRAHRVGQTREVEVVRLVSRCTIEEDIHALGLTKLLLDDRVAGAASTDSDALETEGKKAVEERLKSEITKEPDTT